MERRKPKPRHKSAFSHTARRSVLEEEDWETKRQRLIHEHFDKIEKDREDEDDGEVSTSEESWEDDDDWEERIEREQAEHEADPAAAVQLWRKLWKERTPGGNNHELQNICEGLGYYADIMDEFSHPDELEEEDSESRIFRLWKALYDAGLSAVCTEIAQDSSLLQ